jgi:hypothetical protein
MQRPHRTPIDLLQHRHHAKILALPRRYLVDRRNVTMDLSIAGDMDRLLDV